VTSFELLGVHRPNSVTVVAGVVDREGCGSAGRQPESQSPAGLVPRRGVLNGCGVGSAAQESSGRDIY
jgi:hypothetical protein